MKSIPIKLHTTPRKKYDAKEPLTKEEFDMLEKEKILRKKTRSVSQFKKNMEYNDND